MQAKCNEQQHCLKKKHFQNRQDRDFLVNVAAEKKNGEQGHVVDWAFGVFVSLF